MHQLILVSQSPRRRDLLTAAGYRFRVDAVKLSETIDKNLMPRSVAESLAREKGQAYIAQTKPMKGQGFLILSADTVVVLKGEVLGKPKNSAEAADFLRRLSGNMHSVITGFCVQDVDGKKETLVSDESRVWFRTLARDEIVTYIASGEPFDKAGGYGIQGAAGSFVSKLEGSFSNVVGFPLELFNKMEARNGWKIRA